ncbi:MAG: sensor histidine kinase [Lachnospiraceae bacterium]
MTYYVQVLLLVFIEALCCRIFCETFLIKRYSEKGWINRGFFIGLLIGFMVIALCPSEMYFFKAVASVLFISIFSYLEYYCKWLQAIFLGIGYYGLLICTDRIMLIILDGLPEIETEKIFADPVKSTIIALLCKTILFIVIILINKRIKPYDGLNLVTDKEWIRFLFFPTITIVCMTAFAIEGGAGSQSALVAAFSLVLSNFLLFYIISDVIVREKAILKMRVSQERIKNQMDMYQYMEGVYEEQRKKTHDFKNHLSYVYGLMKAGEFSQAESYIEKINYNWIEEIDYINTNNMIVNSILNQKFKQAKKKGIPILFSINDLGNISMVDEDLVTLLTNLLDNAIEACEKISDSSKVIKMRFIDEAGKITISVKNPVAVPLQYRGRKLETGKDKKSEHGIGMGNIQSVVEKYQGESIWSCNGGYFTHSIIIKY